MADKKCKMIWSILKTNAHYLKRWLMILCNTQEYCDKFVNSFLDITDLECSIFEFQSHLKHTGRGQEISTGQIRDSIEKGDGRQLKILLEELLLIPIDDTEIAKVLKMQDYSKLEDFIETIKIYSNTRYTRVIDEYFYYNC